MAFSASLLSRNLITDTLGETLVEQADIKERIDVYKRQVWMMPARPSLPGMRLVISKLH